MPMKDRGEGSLTGTGGPSAQGMMSARARPDQVSGTTPPLKLRLLPT